MQCVVSSTSPCLMPYRLDPLTALVLILFFETDDRGVCEKIFSDRRIHSNPSHVIIRLQHITRSPCIPFRSSSDDDDDDDDKCVNCELGLVTLRCDVFGVILVVTNFQSCDTNPFMRLIVSCTYCNSWW